MHFYVNPINPAVSGSDICQVTEILLYLFIIYLFNIIYFAFDASCCYKIMNE